MSVEIHPTAVVADDVQLGTDVAIGPYAVIESDCAIGDRSQIHSHAIVRQYTTLHEEVEIHPTAVVGGVPQDRKYVPGIRSYTEIGARTHLREAATVNRGSMEETTTKIGTDGLLMATCHVGHDCQVGDGVIIANGAMLAGHVEIADRVILGGDTAIHQFCRVGYLALTRGGSRLSKDVPPLTIVVENGQIRGFNIVGMRRAGWSSEDRELVKAYYRVLFRESASVAEAIVRLEGEPASTVRDLILDFVRVEGRGLSRPNTGRGYQGEGGGGDE